MSCLFLWMLNMYLILCLKYFAWTEWLDFYIFILLTSIKHFVIISWPGQVSFCGRFPSVICPYIHSPHILIFFLQRRSAQPDYNQTWKRWLMYEKIYTFIQIKLILHWEENLMLSKSLKKKQKNSACSQIEVLWHQF